MNKEKYVCANCVGNKCLQKSIKNKEKNKECSYCGKNDIPCIYITTLKQKISDVILNQFNLIDNYTDHSDTSDSSHRKMSKKNEVFFKDLLWDLMGRSTKKDLIKDLDLQFKCVDSFGVSTNPFAEKDFGDESKYEPQNIGSHYHTKWDHFKSGLFTKSRFFYKKGEEFLDNLFANIETLATDSLPVISEFKPEHQKSLYRARIAYSLEELKKILANPPEELGPPPKQNAINGRMNSSGISVFYGSFELDTCISEIRPPVGSQIVIGCFTFTKPTKLLNLELLKDYNNSFDRFDPKYIEKQEQEYFLRCLVDDVSKPIIINDDPSSYLPTQYLAEYLASKKKLDGIIYPSSQINGGKNIVLFNHAAIIGPLKSEERIDVQLGGFRCDEFVEDIQCNRVLPEKKTTSWDGDWKRKDEDKYLQLEIDQIKVFKIKEVNFKKTSRNLFYYSDN